MTALAFRELLEKHGLIEGCKKAGAPNIQTKKDASRYIWSVVTSYLARNQKVSAAIVLWGTTTFDPRPMSVQKIWKALESNSKLFVMACASVSKSYGISIWLFLDWLRDPEYTATKFLSTTSGHAKANTYSTLVRLFRRSIIKLPGFCTATYIGLDPKDKKSGFTVTAIPRGDSGEGRLQGFHPDPREKPHPIFGKNSRIRVFMDECEHIPIGAWEGVDNCLASAVGIEMIKVIGAFNPSDKTTKTAERARPPGGWAEVKLDGGYRGSNTWLSAEGWWVLRIDGAETENVKQRADIYHGFLSWEGYRAMQLKDGGNSTGYYTFGRGIYPPIGSVNEVVSELFWSRCKGEFIFDGKPINAGFSDIAVDGRDRCVLVKARTGWAREFHRHDGEIIKFPRRKVIQIDQIYEIAKGETKIVGDNLKREALRLSISSEWFGVDSTGNGGAVHSYLRAVWADDVYGLDFGKDATNVKIMDEDTKTPEELYYGVWTEVWFALAKFAEFGLIGILPSVRSDPLDNEVTNRQYKVVEENKLRVEKKDDYVKRIGRSPDYADAVTGLVHMIRMREGITGPISDAPKPKKTRPKPIQHGFADTAFAGIDFDAASALLELKLAA